MIVELLLNDTQPSVEFWKQERLVLKRFATQNVAVLIWSDTDGSRQEPLATYYGDEDGYVYIDVTDYLRASYSDPNNNAATLYVYDDGLDETWDVGVTVMGLINPENVIIPPTALPFFPMLPPFRYIGGFTTIFEVFSAGGLTQTAPRWRSYANGAWSAYEGLSRGLAQRTIAANVERLLFTKPNNPYETILIQEQDCGKEYALVRWVSFTGNTRQHVFELVKPKTSVADAYSLEPIDNEYIEIKGRVDGFVLHLDNLNPYDVWYYSDLLTSSKVEVSLDGVQFDRVQITDKDVTLPTVDGTTSGKVEFNVNWKRYDAVSM